MDYRQHNSHAGFESLMSTESMQLRAESFFSDKSVIPVVDDESVEFGDYRRKDNDNRTLSGNQVIEQDLEAPYAIINRLKNLRLARRQEGGISIEERCNAAQEQPLPSHFEGRTFENLYCYLYNSFEAIKCISSPNDAAKARAAIFIAHVTMQTTNILHNAVDLHNDVDRTDLKKQKRSKAISRVWRKNGSFVQIKLQHTLESLSPICLRQKRVLFKRLRHKTIDSGETGLNVLTNLTDLYHKLNKQIVAYVHGLYNTKAQTTLLLKQDIDQDFICVGRAELKAHLQIIDECLQKAAAICALMTAETFHSMYPCDALKELDKRKLCFITPYVLPNVTVLNEEQNLVEFLHEVEARINL